MSLFKDKFISTHHQHMAGGHHHCGQSPQWWAVFIVFFLFLFSVWSVFCSLRMHTSSYRSHDHRRGQFWLACPHSLSAIPSRPSYNRWSICRHTCILLLPLATLVATSSFLEARTSCWKEWPIIIRYCRLKVKIITISKSKNINLLCRSSYYPLISLKIIYSNLW